MRITKETYAVLKPAARSYWSTINESTKLDMPALTQLRETLLKRNDTKSNLALIEMMMSEGLDNGSKNMLVNILLKTSNRIQNEVLPSVTGQRNDPDALERTKSELITGISLFDKKGAMSNKIKEMGVNEFESYTTNMLDKLKRNISKPQIRTSQDNDNEINDLKSTVTRKDQYIDQLLNQYMEKSKEAKNLQSQLERSSNSETNLKDQLNNVSKERDDLKNEINKLKQQNTTTSSAGKKNIITKIKTIAMNMYNWAKQHKVIAGALIIAILGIIALVVLMLMGRTKTLEFKIILGATVAAIITGAVGKLLQVFKNRKNNKTNTADSWLLKECFLFQNTIKGV